MPVSVIGTRGCGKSTFVGLLYQTMERYTNDPEEKDKFIYYIAPDSLEKVLEIRNAMLSGKFPPITIRRQLHYVDILMGFKADFIERIVSAVKTGWFRNNYAKDYLGMILRIYDVSGEDIEEWRRTKRLLYRGLRELFDANIVVILVDCEKFTEATEGEKYTKMLEYDKELAIILSAYAEYRAKNKPREPIYPIFVLTKLDALEKTIWDRFKLDIIKNMDKYDEDICYEIGNKLMSSYISAANALKKGTQQVGVPLHKAKYFFSWAEVKKIDGSMPAAQDRKLVVIRDSNHPLNVHNVYPEHMYRAFIDYLKELLAKSQGKYADSSQLIQEIFGRSIDDRIRQQLHTYA